MLFVGKNFDGNFSVKVPLTKLDHSSAIDLFYNQGLIFEEAEVRYEFLKFLQKIVKSNLKNLPRKTITKNVGWQENFEFYLGESDSGYMLTDGLTDAMFQPSGDITNWLGGISQLLNNVQVRTALACTFASVCVKLLDCQSVLLLLHGATCSGKSTLQKFCASVWANPGKGKFIRSARSSDCNITAWAMFLGGIPICLDELHARSKQVDQLLMTIAEGVDPGKYEKMTDYSTSSCLLLTAEGSLLSNGSNPGLENRLLEIEILPEMLQGIDVNQVVRSCSRNYGVAGRKFMSGLKNKDTDELDARFWAIKDAIHQYGAENCIPISDKRATMLALLLFGDELACEFVYNDNQEHHVEPLTVEAMVSIFCNDNADTTMVRFDDFRDYILGKGCVEQADFTIKDKVMASETLGNYVLVAQNFAEKFKGLKLLRPVWATKGLLAKNVNGSYLFDKTVDGVKLRFYKVQLRCGTTDAED